MMNDFIVKVEKTTRMVDLPKNVIGNDMENLQEKLIFKFTDEFVNGQGRLEYKIGSTKNYIVLSKENDTYTIPVQNVITKEGKIKMQLVITEGTDEENILVFKSNVFWLYCNKSINAVNEAPEGYTLWIETANAKLNEIDEALQEVDNLNIDANKIDTTTTIEITKKDGTTESVQILDGANGQDGISPIATVTQTSTGATITITDKNGTTTANIVNGGTGGTNNYDDLNNKPSINDVELSGNKTSSDLGLQPAGNYVSDNNYVHTDNNYTSQEKQKLAGLSNYDDTEIKQSIANKVDKVTGKDLSTNDFTSTYKDNVDSNTTARHTHTNKQVLDNITDTDIKNWNNKSNFSGNYNDLTNKPTIPAEVTENTVSGWGFTKNTGTITGITMNGVSKGVSGVVDLGTVITSHQDISGKLDTNKVKNTQSTVAGDVYDVTYINSMIGNIETLLGGI